MRVAIYVRVSTDMQAEEGYSLDAQVDRCKAYAKSQDWDVVAVYIEEGESAKDLNRPEIQRMLSDAGDASFDVLLVYRLDRLTRSVRDLNVLLDLFDKQNIKFRSATEVYDTTTAMGRLFINIVAALAEWERGNLSERVKFAMEQLTKEGRWHGGPVPEGYAWDIESSTMTIVSEEYAVLRELRRLYIAGNGTGVVAKELNLQGKLRRDSNKWSPEAVTYILDNPFYAGKIRYGKKNKNGEVIWADHEYPQIFTWEEYEEHIEIMNKRKVKGRSRKSDHWFTGTLRCARCGSRLNATVYKNRRPSGGFYDPFTTYVCGSRRRKHGCNLPMLRQTVAESMIMEYIKKMIPFSNEEVAASSVDMERSVNDITSEMEKMQKELRSLTERRKKWQYMFVEDMLSEFDFRSRKREEDEQEKILLNAIESLKAVEIGTNTDIMNQLIDLPALWYELSDSDKKEVMQTAFDSIYFDCDLETGLDNSKRGQQLPFKITEVHFN